jgi:FixJ family two-component response regulator
MISGFSRDYVRSEVRMGAWGFLQKPFSKAEFLKAVQKERQRKNS